jgi:hypothetical protein
MALDATSVDATTIWGHGASHATSHWNDAATKPVDDGTRNAMDDA